MAEKASAWTEAMGDAVGAALQAREALWARIPWWWRYLRRVEFQGAVEVYVQSVLRAYHRGAIQGWPPGPDGAPTVDMALLSRQQRRAARRAGMGERRPER